MVAPARGAHRIVGMGWRFIITAFAMLGGSLIGIELLASTLTQLAAR